MADCNSLGGRLPLIPEAALSNRQKRLYQRMQNNKIPWSERRGCEGMTDGGRLGGPFNPLLYSPDVGAGFLDFEHAEDAASSLDERVRQVVILSIGSVWRSDYETYAYSAIALQAGLPEETVRALANGEFATGLTDGEKLAQAYALQLVSEYSVEQSVYERAEFVFGRQGLVDLTLLIGRFLAICAILNGFDIPQPRR